MSLSHQTLSQEDLNLLRNDLIKFHCGPLVYQTIIEWGFEKPEGVKIIEHLKDQKIEENCGRNLKNWFKKYNDELQKEDYSTFDVTTLHDLLPVLCYDKVNQTGGTEYEAKLKDTKSIEYLLKEIKKFRNDVSHEYSKSTEDPKIEEKKLLMQNCIRTAGALYNKDQSEIDAKVAKLDAEFANLMQKTSSSYEYAVQQVTNEIERKCPTFMLEKYSPLFSVPLPAGLGKIDSTEIFESVNMSVADKDKDKTKMVDQTVKDKDETKMVYQKVKDKDETEKLKKTSVKENGYSKKNKILFRSNEICNHVSYKFVVINGGPGSGKTTLTRHIFQNILENAVNGRETSYEGIGKFRVPIYLECRTERQTDLRDFLKENIRNLNYSKEVIYEAFKNVTGQIFIIDGYDEVNDKSRELVSDATEYCSKYNATCIVSGRVDAGNNFISILKEKKLSYNEMLIEPISEMSDKLSLLRRYGDKMSDVDSDELEKSFENLNDSAHKVFSCPVLLALFISLFVNHRDSLSQLHNEQSAYKAMREIFSEEIEKKLKENNIANPELRAKLLLEVLSDHSLRLFRIKKYFFDKEEFLCLSNYCLQKISNYDVDIKWVFSCILTPETSFRSEKTLTYAFSHSSIQDYLAVGHIYKNMEESKIDWNSEEHSEDSLRSQFLDCFGVSASLSDGSTSDGSTSDGSTSDGSTSDGSTSDGFTSDGSTSDGFTSDESTSDGSYSEEKLSVFDEKFSVLKEEKFYGVKKKINRYGNIIKLLILETLENRKLKKYTRTFTAVLREYFVPESALTNDYLLDLVLSSSCDSTIVSIVSNILGDEDGYFLHYPRHIRPMTELLKRKTRITFGLEFSESLTNSDYVNLGKLMSVLEDGSKIMLFFKHSFINYQPLTGEFYSQLKNIRCEVSLFFACVTSSEHLSIVRSVCRNNKLYISTVSACDVSFAILKGYKDEIALMVKYTDDCPSTGSNAITENTFLVIENIPAEGKENVYKIIKYLSPKSKEFMDIELANCHLNDTDANKLLKKLEGEEITTKKGKKTEMKKGRKKKNKSRNMKLYLSDFEWMEAAKREAARREAARREAARREAAKRVASKREASKREASKREAAQREAAQREAAQREAAQREAAQREAAQGKAEQQRIKIKNKSKLSMFGNFFS